MSLLPDFIINKIFDKMKTSCRQMARIELDSINTSELANQFPNLPVVYIYSSKDEFISSSDSMLIFSKLRTEFKLFVDCQVPHNHKRPEEKTNKVFFLLKDLWKKYERKKKRVQLRKQQKMQKQQRSMKRSRSGLAFGVRQKGLKLASKKVLFEKGKAGDEKVKRDANVGGLHDAMKKRKFNRSRKKNMSMGDLRELREKVRADNVKNGVTNKEKAKVSGLPIKKPKSRRAVRRPAPRVRGKSEKQYIKTSPVNPGTRKDIRKLKVLEANKKRGKTETNNSQNGISRQPNIHKSFLSQKEQVKKQKLTKLPPRSKDLNDPYKKGEFSNNFAPSNEKKTSQSKASLEFKTTELDTRMGESVNIFQKEIDPKTGIVTMTRIPYDNIASQAESLNYFSVNSKSGDSQQVMIGNNIASLRMVKVAANVNAAKNKHVARPENLLQVDRFKKKNFVSSKISNVVISPRPEGSTQFNLPNASDGPVKKMIIPRIQTDSNRNINTSSELRNLHRAINNRALVNPLRTMVGKHEGHVIRTETNDVPKLTPDHTAENKNLAQKKRISERISQNLKFIQRPEEIHRIQATRKQQLVMSNQNSQPRTLTHKVQAYSQQANSQNSDASFKRNPKKPAKSRFISPMRVNLQLITKTNPDSKAKSKISNQIRSPYSPYLDISRGSKMDNSLNQSMNQVLSKENSKLDSSFNSNIHFKVEPKHRVRGKAHTQERFFQGHKVERRSEIVQTQQQREKKNQVFTRGSSIGTTPNRYYQSITNHMVSDPNTQHHTPISTKSKPRNETIKIQKLRLSQISVNEGKGKDFTTPKDSLSVLDINPKLMKTTEAGFQTFREDKRNVKIQIRKTPSQRQIGRTPPKYVNDLKQNVRSRTAKTEPKYTKQIKCFQTSKTSKTSKTANPKKRITYVNPKSINNKHQFTRTPILKKRGSNHTKIQYTFSSKTDLRERNSRNYVQAKHRQTKNSRQFLTIDKISQNLMGLKPISRPDLRNLVKRYNTNGKNFSSRTYHHSGGSHTSKNLYNELIQKLARKP